VRLFASEAVDRSGGLLERDLARTSKHGVDPVMRRLVSLSSGDAAPTLDAVDRLMELALVVKAVHRELERWVNEAMRPLGVTAAQADALVVISQAEPVSLKELGDLLIAESGHPSRLVDRLVEADLVARRDADDDRRRVVLTVTAKGRRLVARIADARREMMRVAESMLPLDELGPALALGDALLAGSPSAELIARRRELETRTASPIRRRR
jgi:MarR family transcriptional regulator, organic hydroperoxide resistance regulator